MHELRFCRPDELNKIQCFIERSWRKGHVFSQDDELLRWQHLETADQRFNFVVAENPSDGEWDAILGFVPLWHFDRKLEAQRDLWLAIWKAEERRIEDRGLGIRLLSFLKKKLQPRSIGSIGLSPIARSIYQATGYTVGSLKHFYRLRGTRIAQFPSGPKPHSGTGSLSLRPLGELRELDGVPFSFKPQKTPLYLWNRYRLHPRYRYQIHIITRNGLGVAVMVLRKIEVVGSSCLRIVDFQGELEQLAGLGPCLEQLLWNEGAEYIDCLNHGLPAEWFLEMGFVWRQGDEIVLPHHFEPFEPRNVEVMFAYRAQHPDYVIFKGDSDLDRPNRRDQSSGEQT